MGVDDLYVVLAAKEIDFKERCEAELSVGDREKFFGEGLVVV